VNIWGLGYLIRTCKLHTCDAIANLGNTLCGTIRPNINNIIDVLLSIHVDVIGCPLHCLKEFVV
jgi:hypothetical protein